MCVAAVAHAAHPDWTLVALANRDEFHARPSAPLSRWDNGILAGRDLQAGGTWLGVAERGRFALVTNFRSDAVFRPALVSRGGLVPGWLLGEEVAGQEAMNPFSLLLADLSALRYATNHPQPSEAVLAPGIHGVSNGPFAAPWAKTQALNAALADWLGAGSHDLEPLFAALADTTPLSMSGPGPEPRFSSVMIRDEAYGTRCSTVVAIDSAGRGRIAERSFDPQGAVIGEVALDFAWT